MKSRALHVECANTLHSEAWSKMYEPTVQVMTTPETSMMTCTLVPAFAGSCLNRINKNGKMVPMHVLAVTMAKREVEMANGPTKSFAPSGLVRITRAKPAVESAVARINPT